MCSNGVYDTTNSEYYWDLNWTLYENTYKNATIIVELYFTNMDNINYKNKNKNNNFNEKNNNNDIITTQPSFNIEWSFMANDTQKKENMNATYETIDSKYITNDLRMLEKQRMIFQNNLTNNTWSHWYGGNNLMIVRLPETFGITLGVCDGSYVKSLCNKQIKLCEKKTFFFLVSFFSPKKDLFAF